MFERVLALLTVATLVVGTALILQEDQATAPALPRPEPAPDDDAPPQEDGTREPAPTRPPDPPREGDGGKKGKGKPLVKLPVLGGDDGDDD